LEIKRSYLPFVRRWAWLFVLVPLAAGIASYRYFSQARPSYQATVRLLIGPSLDSPNPDLNTLRAAGQLMFTYAEVVETRPFLEAVRNELELNAYLFELKDAIVVLTDANTQILTIEVQDPSASRASLIANTIAAKLVTLSPTGPTGSQAVVEAEIQGAAAKLQDVINASEARIQQLEAELREAADTQASAPDPLIQDLISGTETRIRDLHALLNTTTDLMQQRELVDQILRENARLAELQVAIVDRQPRILNDLSTERARLSDAYRTLTLLNGSINPNFTNQVKIIEPSDTGRALASRLQLQTLIGALTGLVLILVLAWVVEFFDDTLRVAEDFVQVSGLPALGVIPNHKRISGVGRKRLVVTARPESEAAEAYRLLGTKLLFLHAGDTALRTILITSLDREADHGQIAANLAVTLARAGRRVIAIDADFHHPSLSQLFDGLESHDPGDTLTDPSEQTGLALVEGVSGLSVLPIRPTSLSPHELLASTQTAKLIQPYEHQADIVLIAAPPPLQSANTLVLASHVDGVLLVARAGDTRLQDVTRTLERLRLVSAAVIGISLTQPRWGGRLGRLSRDALSALGRRLGGIIRAQRALVIRLAGRLRPLGREIKRRLTIVRHAAPPSTDEPQHLL
jgi:Mrp family chromosome partitioning ATPase/capsular polysaccharide biosynthesis protein